jgi:hypothetical protein
MQEIQVRRQGRRANAIQDESIAEERPIEGLAIERNDTRALLHALPKPVQHRRFTTQIGQEKLLNSHGLVLEPGDANQEGHRSGAAGEPGGLGVEKQGALKIDLGEQWIERELSQTLGRHLERLGDRRTPVVMTWFQVRIDQVQLSVVGLTPLARERAPNARDIEIPRRGLCESGEISFDRHRISVGGAHTNGIEQIKYQALPRRLGLIRARSVRSDAARASFITSAALDQTTRPTQQLFAFLEES